MLSFFIWLSRLLLRVIFIWADVNGKRKHRGSCPKGDSEDSILALQASSHESGKLRLAEPISFWPKFEAGGINSVEPERLSKVCASENEIVRRKTR